MPQHSARNTTPGLLFKGLLDDVDAVALVCDAFHTFCLELREFVKLLAVLLVCFLPRETAEVRMTLCTEAMKEGSMRTTVCKHNFLNDF